jgi:thiol-disulfide isomerase/thioredoxin
VRFVLPPEAILILALGLCVPSPSALAATPGEVEVGSTLREAPLYGLFHDFRKLSDFRGKPLIINVWASWCGPCRAEMSSLDRLARKYNGKQLNIIGISTDDYPERATAYLLKSGVSFDNYLDRNLLWEHMLGADTIPLTVLVDAKGRVVGKVRGAKEWDSPEMLALVGRSLGLTLRP